MVDTYGLIVSVNFTPIGFTVDWLRFLENEIVLRTEIRNNTGEIDRLRAELNQVRYYQLLLAHWSQHFNLVNK